MFLKESAFFAHQEKCMKTLQCDVVVAGGGPAGTFAAVKAAENGADVILLDKGYVGKSGCGTFGAGSFKAYLKEEDSFDLWYGKAVEEGFFINDQDWKEYLEQKKAELEVFSAKDC